MHAYLAGETNSFGAVLGLAVILTLGVTVWAINKAWMRHEARRNHRARIEPCDTPDELKEKP